MCEWEFESFINLLVWSDSKPGLRLRPAVSRGLTRPSAPRINRLRSRCVRPDAALRSGAANPAEIQDRDCRWVNRLQVRWIWVGSARQKVTGSVWMADWDQFAGCECGAAACWAGWELWSTRAGWRESAASIRWSWRLAADMDGWDKKEQGQCRGCRLIGGSHRWDGTGGCQGSGWGQTSWEIVIY